MMLLFEMFAGADVESFSVSSMGLTHSQVTSSMMAHVTEVDFSHNNLNDGIVDSLLAMPFLEKATLLGNQLGSFPVTLLVQIVFSLAIFALATCLVSDVED